MVEYVFTWNEEKNSLLKKSRGVCFEDIVLALEAGNPSIDEPHPNQKKYPHQHQLVVLINNYAVVVPYVVDEARKLKFFKTLYPSRKYTKYFLPLQP